MKKAFIVVGHSNWGKSKTFYYFSGEKTQLRYMKINDIIYRLKRMSNDDYSEVLLNFIKEMIKQDTYDLIFAFCPDFLNKGKYSSEILKLLRKAGYKLFFFILNKKYGRNSYISQEEVNELNKYGKINIYNKSENAEDRSKALRKYILMNQ